jgi:hypothetical protein
MPAMDRVRHATIRSFRDDGSERAKTVWSKYPEKSLSDNRTKPIWEDGSETAPYRGSGRLFKPRSGPTRRGGAALHVQDSAVEISRKIAPTDSAALVLG